MSFTSLLHLLIYHHGWLLIHTDTIEHSPFLRLHIALIKSFFYMAIFWIAWTKVYFLEAKGESFCKRESCKFKSGIKLIEKLMKKKLGGELKQMKS